MNHTGRTVLLCDFDGIIKIAPYGLFQLIAFEPRQIKSIDNPGTWDPSDPKFQFRDNAAPDPAAPSTPRKVPSSWTDDDDDEVEEGKPTVDTICK